ncbi:MAG TPA: T9SS type A sorting domain-containing protein [Chitinophagales bacterium]|nr:T9SS type A sorting domain-containing protein [Chitinophagales bacterium]
MKTILRLFSCLLFALSVHHFAKAQVIVSSNCVPPLDTNTAYTSQFHVQALAGLIDLNNVVHYGFSQCTTPPDSFYQSETDSFSSTIAGDLSVNSGQTFTHIVSPCQTQVFMQYGGTNGDTTYYNTYMMQLDISGGTLPAGYMVRESPTLNSTGVTKITPVGNQYLISSYFNIYIELTNDNGIIWIPADSVAHVELHAINTGVSETPLFQESIQVSPNPFAEKSFIQFNVADAGKATLKIYNTSGIEIATLFASYAEPYKTYSAVFDGKNLVPGVYIYELRSERKMRVGKMVLIR